MLEKILCLSGNIMNKFLGFLSKRGNENKKINVIIITIALIVSMILYCLFVLQKVQFRIDIGGKEQFLESTLGIMFSMIKTNNSTLGNIATLLFINFPAVLLINGVYNIKSFYAYRKCTDSEQKAKQMIILGYLIILASLVIICFTFVTKNQMLIYSSIVTYITTSIMILYFLVIKKIDHFSVRQLMFLYFSVILFIIIFIIILIAIAIIVINIVILFIMAAGQGESSSSQGEIKKHKIKRDENFPDRGVLVDKYGAPLTDSSGRVVEVRDINEQNLTATVNGEKIDLEENK